MLLNYITFNKRDTGHYKVIDIKLFGFQVFHTLYTFHEKDLHISCFTCEPLFRRQGLCTFMIDYLKKEAKSKGCNRLTLHCDPTNGEASACYVKSGFVKISDTVTSNMALLL